jgi:hypothetical protein
MVSHGGTRLYVTRHMHGKSRGTRLWYAKPSCMAYALEKRSLLKAMHVPLGMRVMIPNSACHTTGLACTYTLALTYCLVNFFSIDFFSIVCAQAVLNTRFALAMHKFIDGCPCMYVCILCRV